MKKLRWIILSGLVAIIGARDSNALLIDNFNTAPANLVANSVSPAVRSIDDGSGILGGERESTLFYDGAGSSTPGDASARIDFLSDGTLFHNQDAGVAAGTVFVYDGNADTNTPTGLFEVDATGLGGLDLTSGGADDRFQFTVLFADQSVQDVLDLRVYSDATHYSDLLKSFPNPISSATPFDFLYSDFTLGDGASGMADFTNVGAIIFLIDGREVPALDLQLDQLATAGAPVVPEPSALVLSGFGLLLLAGLRKRPGFAIRGLGANA